jgi:hypothetical protein
MFDAINGFAQGIVLIPAAVCSFCWGAAVFFGASGAAYCMTTGAGAGFLVVNQATARSAFNGLALCAAEVRNCVFNEAQFGYVLLFHKKPVCAAPGCFGYW